MAQEEKLWKKSLYFEPWLRELLKEAIIFDKFIDDLLSTLHEVELAWTDQQIQDKCELHRALGDFMENVPNGEIYSMLSKNIEDSIAMIKMAENLVGFRGGVMRLIKIQDRLASVEHMFSCEVILQVKQELAKADSEN